MIYRAHSSVGSIRVGSGSGSGAWCSSTGASDLAEFIIAATFDSPQTLTANIFSSTAGSFFNSVLAIRIK